MSLLSYVALLVGVMVVLYGYHCVKKSIPLKYVQRCAQRERFKAFVKIAMSPEFNVNHLNHFWKTTKDCDDLFTSYSVLRMRRELFDHGNMLIEIKLKANQSSLESQAELQLITDETLHWFQTITTKIEGAFKPETTRNNSLRQVLDEAFRITGRSLRT